MNRLPGYKIVAKIYESTRTIVFRGCRTESNEAVILKFFNENHSSPVDVARYQHEFTIIRSLALECVIKAYAIEIYEDQPFIVFEDFGGICLNNLMTTKRLGLEEGLTTAVDMVDAIAKIHAAGITHKDINPSNIVMNPASGQLKIIDFGMATALSSQEPLMKHPNVLEGTLAYMSPEQTGRMSRAVDYRTDFYSLGVTLYEMFCRKRPFESDDNLELVHAHIAKVPQAPHKKDSTIPEAISDIIMKLLAKNAEDRYQSPLGIRLDLDECLNQWKKQGKIERFSIAQHDVADKFQIQKKLYGREKETETLMQAFRRVTEGNRELLLVTGAPGIGKSILVREVYTHASIQPGGGSKIRFISGKYDRLQRDIPYSAVVSAFQVLVRQLLSESDATLVRWRKQLLDALGPNGQIIIDVIPEFELVVGPQPTVATLGPNETQNRFNLVFQNFMRVFCRSQQPLTIFLDDLQWADAASLKLIELMIMDQKLGYLLLIGAYRANEIDPDGPLAATLDSIAKQGADISRIDLAALDNNHIGQMIVESLQCDKKRAIPLAVLISQKTGGNPFFAEMFLKSLNTQNLLQFDRRLGCWQWDLEQVQNIGINDDVVDLVVRKIQQFDDKTQRVLQLAACLGNPFKLETLAKLCNLTVEDTATALQQALAEGLIAPTGHASKIIGEKSGNIAQGFVDEYSFLHDRIQQAAYSLIRESERPAIHRNVGQHFLAVTPKDRKQEKIFDIVNQLNLGRELIKQQSERDELATLNLKAGNRAKVSTAYEPALNYFQVGIALLGKNGWQRQYEMTLALHVEATEAAYLCAQYGEMEKLAAIVLQYARTLLDTAKVYEVHIDAFKAQYKLQEALKTAKPVLRMLGVRLPSKPSNLHILLNFTKSRLQLAGKQTRNLVTHREMKDPIKLASMRVIMRASSAAYLADPLLLPIIVFKGISLLLKHGIVAEAAFLYAVYGLILCGVVGNVEAGYKFGELALSVLERFDAKELKARTYFIVFGFVLHWKMHVRQTIEPFAEAFKSGQETGDFEYAGFSGLFYSFCSFVSGRDLSQLEREMPSYGEVIARLKHEPPFHMHQIYHQTVLNLRGQSENPRILIGECYDETKMLSIHTEANDRTTLCNLYFNKLFLCYLFRDYSQAVEMADITESYLDGVIGTLVVPLFYFYDSLARLATCSKERISKRKGSLKRIGSNQKKMKKWAHHAPMNHLHKFYLVEAELHRILGQNDEAGDFYDQAIKLAKKNEFTNEEALANELAGRFYLERGKAVIARAYLQEALHCYKKWGALAKIKDLNERYIQLLSHRSNASTTDGKSVTSNIASSTTNQHEHLDLATVMKASQAISGEVVMAELMKQLMAYIIENAGAQKGFLVLNIDGRLQIEASIIADPLSIEVLQSTPIERCRDLSLDIVRFVFRSAEDLVIHDASEAKQFDQDLYIHRNNPKSILCMPIRQKDSPSGVLYLENNLTTAAFTEDRIKVLRILLSQAAISLENARLYEDLKQEIIDRKQAQKDLLHLATAIEQAAEGILITDRSGTVHYTNPAFEKISDYSQKEIIGQNSKILRSDHHPESFYTSMWQRITSGKVWSGRISTKKKDNTICELEVTISPVKDSKNNIISFVSVNRDVTREIQMEKELHQAQKMEAIGTLAGGIAHDFNNILSAIIGYSELALLDLPPENMSRSQIQEVLTAGNRAKALVEQILTFSRQHDQKMEPLRVAPIVTEALKLLRASLPATIEILTKVEAETEIVKADPTQIHQVVMNLSTNAAHAMGKKGGTLEVSLANTEIDAQTASENPSLNQGSYLRLTVKDNGPGMDHALLQRIFEPFFTSKGPGEGTGMGLAVAHGIVKRHKGAISVESEPEVGTAFHVFLPIADEKSKPKEKGKVRQILLGSGRILLVDDEKAIVDMGQQILERLGYQVTAKTSSLEALETFKAKPDIFDLVITDQTMPMMTGVELAEAFMRIRPDIPMILCSGYNQTITPEEAKNLGIREYILKPFSMGTISETIQKVLNN
ncbi:Serine/Threonine protein kinase and Signal Transduction Histidine Kinase (STHK) with GAF sensor (EC [Olavius sp. associated proteobacterium Delta 1]|nr:Serine/Threonine protein kinase and Signal Transduction Histidine Kinase (STHK) with GAF sensor (EC [Olavius sp. associated proteobacterium Delta 1]